MESEPPHDRLTIRGGQARSNNNGPESPAGPGEQEWQVDRRSRHRDRSSEPPPSLRRSDGEQRGGYEQRELVRRDGEANGNASPYPALAQRRCDGEQAESHRVKILAIVELEQTADDRGANSDGQHRHWFTESSPVTGC